MPDVDQKPLPPGTYVVQPVGRDEHTITLRVVKGEYEGRLLYAPLSQLLSPLFQVTTIRSVDGSAFVDECEPCEE